MRREAGGGRREAGAGKREAGRGMWEAGRGKREAGNQRHSRHASRSKYTIVNAPSPTLSAGLIRASGACVAGIRFPLPASRLPPPASRLPLLACDESVTRFLRNNAALESSIR